MHKDMDHISGATVWLGTKATRKEMNEAFLASVSFTILTNNTPLLLTASFSLTPTLHVTQHTPHLLDWLVTTIVE